MLDDDFREEQEFQRLALLEQGFTPIHLRMGERCASLRAWSLTTNARKVDKKMDSSTRLSATLRGFPVLYMKVAVLAAAGFVISIVSFPAASESWKQLGFRASDKEPVWVDVDYRVRQGNYFEMRTRWNKVKESAFSPDIEYEAKYLVDCRSPNKLANLYRRAKTGQSANVELDLVPTAVTWYDLPVNSLYLELPKFACADQQKAPVAKAEAPAAPIPSGLIPDNALSSLSWKHIDRSASKQSADRVVFWYIAPPEHAKNNVYGVLVKTELRLRADLDKLPTDQSVFVWAIDCEQRVFAELEYATFDSSGKLQSRKVTEKPTQESFQAKTVGDTVRAHVCAKHVAKPKEAPSYSSGTAWYSDRGYFVTAYHVVRGATEIVLKMPNGQKAHATVELSDEPNDVAILSAPAPAGQPGLHLADRLPSVGAEVFAVGYPHPEVMGLQQKFTYGVVNSLTGIQDDPRMLQVQAPIQSGNSGGPLVNSHGEVVGIVSVKLKPNQGQDVVQNVNYAVKARYVQALLDDLGAPPSPKPKSPKTLSSEEVAGIARPAVAYIEVVRAKKP